MPPSPPPSRGRAVPVHIFRPLLLWTPAFRVPGHLSIALAASTGWHSAIRKTDTRSTLCTPVPRLSIKTSIFSTYTLWTADEWDLGHHPFSSSLSPSGLAEGHLSLKLGLPFSPPSRLDTASHPHPLLKTWTSWNPAPEQDSKPNYRAYMFFFFFVFLDRPCFSSATSPTYLRNYTVKI